MGTRERFSRPRVYRLHTMPQQSEL